MKKRVYHPSTRSLPVTSTPSFHSTLRVAIRVSSSIQYPRPFRINDSFSSSYTNSPTNTGIRLDATVLSPFRLNSITIQCIEMTQAARKPMVALYIMVKKERPCTTPCLYKAHLPTARLPGLIHTSTRIQPSLP